MTCFSKPLRKPCSSVVLLGACCLLLMVTQPGQAAESTGGFECRWADGPIQIDGRANDTAWQRAQVITNFSMPWLGDGKHPAPTATEARMLWDREYLYFFAQMQDADLYADVTNHDGTIWDNDVFELFFKPAKDKKGYYEFQVNAANATLDMFLPSRGAGGYGRFKADGEFQMETKVLLRGTLNKWEDKDEGWSVEGRIPWRDFMRTGGRREPGEEWSFALCRYDYSVELDEPALSTCAPLSKMDFHHFEDYAPLRFVGPAQSSKPFGIAQRTLWTNSHVIGSPNPPFAYQTVRVFPELQVQLPVAIANEPGSERLIFIEHTAAWGGFGKVRRIPNESQVKTAETLLVVDDIVYGITFHPKFKENGYLYLGSNGPYDKGGKKTRIVRYTMARTPPYGIDPASKQTIIEWEADGHNGGDMVFGLDGMLYVTSGDGTSDSDRNIVGQDLTRLTSKVLRIDVDHPSEGRAYSIPQDNPFLKVPGARPETWAYGLRNPWRITVDKVTGHLWVGENGQDQWEMARLIQRGANYGWSVYEGSHPFNLQRKMGPDSLTPPTIEHPHSEFRSLSGGVVYYGKKLPKLRGAYIYGDWSTGRIWGAKHNGQQMEWHAELVDTPFAITGFGVDAEGELLVVDEGTGFYRLEPASGETPTNRFPSRLSETGLFLSVKENRPNPALVPYSVNSPLWSDGADKERFIAIPENTKIDFTFNRGWNFPEGAVLVKTFALNVGVGASAKRRNVETRLLTRQQKEWVGYSYMWNDEQSDATLVDAAGTDKAFVVTDIDTHRGSRNQTWHYPSRTECMVCHSRAANFVLGLTEQQMNRDYPYANGSDNQLRVLEHLGMLKVDWAGYERDAVPRELSGIEAKERAGRLKLLEAAPGQRKAVEVSSLLPRDPGRMRRLPDPGRTNETLTARARSYLQANCAHCHVEAGGGNSLMDLEFTTSAAAMKVMDVKPQHLAFELAEARLIAPGHPERSVLLHRISNRGEGHMPPLATSVVDKDAVEMLRAWIAEMQ
ncbi:MAG TPA: PQQ-dependent sugar dehydrogenase [Candidatus Saccharimonadales bacterium]|nr:PQQ-dependent sugar dehydrogenase [Candidatus Saccharimonadales bacterium]